MRKTATNTGENGENIETFHFYYLLLAAII